MRLLLIISPSLSRSNLNPSKSRADCPPVRDSSCLSDMQGNFIYLRFLEYLVSRHYHRDQTAKYEERMIAKSINAEISLSAHSTNSSIGADFQPDMTVKLFTSPPSYIWLQQLYGFKCRFNLEYKIYRTIFDQECWLPDKS